MKRIHFSFAIVFFLIFNLVFTSCKSGDEKEENPLADSLNGENSNLKGQLSEKEVALQQFVTAFNEIQTNLNEIKEKEKLIAGSTAGGDIKSKEEQIKLDIQAIYDLMGKNKSRIRNLNKKLKDADSKIKGLDELVANLEKQLDEKDAEIVKLKSSIEQLNIELSNLNLSYNELSQESEVKEQKLQTAFYAMGTLKELVANNVVTKEGGFIGMGKTASLKNDFNKDYFTKINITEFKSLSLNAKKVKIVSNHPSSSYTLVGQKPVEKLEIKNSEEFWSNSKFLVLIIE